MQDALLLAPWQHACTELSCSLTVWKPGRTSWEPAVTLHTLQYESKSSPPVMPTMKGSISSFRSLNSWEA